MEIVSCASWRDTKASLPAKFERNVTIPSILESLTYLAMDVNARENE
jgi:hypothetical protein